MAASATPTAAVPGPVIFVMAAASAGSTDRCVASFDSSWANMVAVTAAVMSLPPGTRPITSLKIALNIAAPTGGGSLSSMFFLKLTIACSCALSLSSRPDRTAS
jgi:hypothetical protein